MNAITANTDKLIERINGILSDIASNGTPEQKDRAVEILIGFNACRQPEIPTDHREVELVLAQLLTIA